MREIIQRVIRLYNTWIKRSFIRFAIVGTVGFIVNYISLIALYDVLSLPIVIAQLFGAELALLATFTGNNYWAFTGHEHHPTHKKFAKFHMTAWAGIGINSGIVIALVHYGHVFYGLALAIGSAVALIWNYILNSKFVFSKSKQMTGKHATSA